MDDDLQVVTREHLEVVGAVAVFWQPVIWWWYGTFCGIERPVTEGVSHSSAILVPLCEMQVSWADRTEKHVQHIGFFLYYIYLHEWKSSILVYVCLLIQQIWWKLTLCDGHGRSMEATIAKWWCISPSDKHQEDVVPWHSDGRDVCATKPANQRWGYILTIVYGQVVISATRTETKYS